MQRSSAFFLLFISLVLTTTLIGADRPGVGDKAGDFSLPTLKGETVQLSGITGNGPVVLVVLRGYPGYQCPACNRQVQDFLSKAKEFSGVGAEVVLVYPGPDDNLVTRAREFASGKQFPENFHLLLDPGYRFTNQYGLRWNAPRETAYPATFLLDKKGTIFFAKISDSHGGRTSAAEILEALQQNQAGQ